jgi:hypothetical protein
MKTALVAVFCLTVGYTVYNSQNKNENLTNIMLDNVEALAQSEWGGNNCRMNTDTWLCYPWASGTGCYCGS